MFPHGNVGRKKVNVRKWSLLPSEHQFGFRKGRSCTALLLSTVDDRHLAQNSSRFTASAFIDLSKAFDNVRHNLQLLVHMLQKYGLGGSVLQWFDNYLCRRMQHISLGDQHCTFTTSKEYLKEVYSLVQ